MKYQHVKREFTSPFYIHFKKHSCPDCGARMRTVKVSEIVNSNSPKAKGFDFSNADNYMIGAVKFIWTEFQCPKCKKQFTVNEMKQIEKSCRAV